MRMRVSMKTEYGFRAVLELAANAGRGALQSAEIARRQAIPGPFLDQVLMTLRRAGMVNSTRGPHGGHQLARRPEDIRLDEVIDCLEGEGRDNRQNGAENGDHRVLQQVWEKAEAAAREVFAAHTLADCLRLRLQQPRVFHGIFHSATSRGD
ncbi:MAG TPA: Rrf2 family transcriptional regulator [Candidatus Dormibacteraeota bacterium]|nr:Rrf2 family transcriptional regulator [Candidatus Dormibacteraeota bacterium]